MSRIQGLCKGDCSMCELLANGEVDMIPCVLDQIFQRVQRNEKVILGIQDRTMTKNVFVSVEQTNEKEDELQANGGGCES